MPLNVRIFLLELWTMFFKVVKVHLESPLNKLFSTFDLSMFNTSVRVIQYVELKYICILSGTSFVLSCFLLSDHSFCCAPLHSPTLCYSASCILCTAMLDDPTALKHHGYLSVCLRNQPSPLLVFAMSVCLCWLCLWYLCCSWAQTARADVKHINRLHRPQLNYKDTQFSCALFMHSLL